MDTPTKVNSQISSNFNSAQDLADRQLFDLAPIASHVIDINGVIREVNQELCRMLGFHRDELIGLHIWEFVAVEHQQTAREAIARKVARQQPNMLVEREFRCADGRYLWVEIHNKLIENAEGDVIGIGAAMLDITQRRKLDEEIRRQHDWIKFALRSSTRAIVTANALGAIGVMNPAAEKMTGWSQKEAIGNPLEKVCCIRRDSGEAVDLMSCILEEPVASNRLRSFTIVDRSGVAQSVKWTITPIWNDDNVIVGATLVLEP